MEKVEARGWLVKAERGNFVVVTRSSYHAMRIAGIIAPEKYGAISLIEEIGEAVYITELTEPQEVDGLGKDILQLFELQVP